MKRSIRFSLKIIACLTVVSFSTSLVHPLTIRATPQTHRGEETGKKEPCFWDKYKWYILGGGALLTLTAGGIITYLLKRRRKHSRVEPGEEIELNSELSVDLRLREAALWEVLIDEKDNPLFFCADKQRGTRGFDTGNGTPFDIKQQMKRNLHFSTDEQNTFLSTEKGKINQHINNVCPNSQDAVRFKKFLALLLLNRRPGSPTLSPPATNAISSEFGEGGITLMKKLLEPLGIKSNAVASALETTIPSAYLGMTNEARVEVARQLAEKEILREIGLCSAGQVPRRELSREESIIDLRKTVSSRELSQETSGELNTSASQNDIRDIFAIQNQLSSLPHGDLHTDEGIRNFRRSAVFAKELETFIVEEKLPNGIQTIEDLFTTKREYLEKTATIFNEYVFLHLAFNTPRKQGKIPHDTLERVYKVIDLFGYGETTKRFSNQSLLI